MYVTQQIVENGLAFAQMAYLDAKAKGIPSPVIELWATDADNPGDITFTTRDLPTLLGWLRGLGPRGVALSRSVEMPPDEGRGVRARLGRLDEPSRRVVELRFGLGGEGPMTLREVGRRLGLSREGVREIEKRAIARLGEAQAAVPA